MAEDLIPLQMSETLSEPRFQPQRMEQCLEYYDAGERCKLTFLAEPDARNLVDLCVNFGFTRFHLRWPPEPVFFVFG